MARRGIIIEIIGDERSYLRAAENTIATNTKLNTSFKSTGVSAKLAADAQIAAAVRSQEAMRANIARFSAVAAGPRSPQQAAAVGLLAAEQARLARATGVTAAETAAFSRSAKTAEREVNTFARGALSGSGVMSRFGRSLAFASSSFIGFAIGASIIAKSITAAEDLEKAQRSLGVAIQHTGGNLRELLPRYEAIAKAAGQFGISQTEATTGLARATVLTGNAAAAQRAYQEALVISKATGKEFNTALTATAKAQAGITTSLRRYGILVTSTMKGTEQFRLVMKRFGGQAEANTTRLDQLRAELTNTAAAIGTALLPTFNEIVSGFSKWLTKMNETGKLQRDVSRITHDTVAVFRTIGHVIGIVDKVTGSFANTLEGLVLLKFASITAAWISKLKLLAATWGVVAGSARTAAIAESEALGAGALKGGTAAAAAAQTAKREAPLIGGGAAGGLLPLLLGANAARLLRGGGLRDTKIADRIKQYTDGVTKTGVEATRSSGRIALLARGLRGITGTLIALTILPKELNVLGKALHNLTHPDFGALPRPRNQLGNFVIGNSEIGVSRQGRLLLADRSQFNTDQLKALAKQFGLSLRQLEEGVRPTPALAKRLGVTLKELNDGIQSVLNSVAVVTPQLRAFPRRRSIVPPELQAPGFAPPPPDLPKPLPRVTNAVRSFGKAIRVWSNFQLSFAENLAQARAALTQSSADDVAAAREVVARIKRAIDQGHLKGKSLLAALQVEGSALSTIWSAEQQAAQDRAAKAQAMRDRIVQQIQNAIDPLKLEVELSRAQAFGKPILPRLKALLRAAEDGLRKAIRAHNLELEKEALDQITSLKQQIKDARTQTTQAFTVPPRLQLNLARDEALGRDTTKDLLKIRAAILKFIRTHKKNIAALTDAYQQLAQINEQLGSSAQSALGAFKQASTQMLTRGLGLTKEQRAALRARLSQLGPGGTVPSTGTGAEGFIIGPNGRPLAVKQTPSAVTKAARQQPNPLYTPRFGRLLTSLEKLSDRPIRLIVELDGKVIADSTTRHQQKRRGRNPSQRRGPNAGLVGA